MPTGQVIADNVLSHLGLNGPDGAAGPNDSATVMKIANVMWKAWGVDEGLIWGQVTYQANLSASRAVYSIGTGGDLNTTRPARVYKAFALGTTPFAGTTDGTTAVILSSNTSAINLGQLVIGVGVPANSFAVAINTNVSVTISNPTTAAGTNTLQVTTGNRNEIKIVEAGQYYDHNDLGATAFTPDEIYFDYLTSGTAGLSNLYLYPVPRQAPLALELDMAVPFTAWALGTNYEIPDAVQDPLEWAIAFRCLSTFGVAVQPQVAAVVTAMGQKSEDRLRAANAFNRQLPPQVVMAPGAKPAAAA